MIELNQGENDIRYFIIRIRSGAGLYLHEIFDKAGFKVFTPFEKKTKYPRSRFAKSKGVEPVVVAEPLFSAYLFVGTHDPIDLALTKIGFIKNKRADIYNCLMSDAGVVTLTEQDLADWRQEFSKCGECKKNHVLSGYDIKRDKLKKKKRGYGNTLIIMPEFTPDDVAQFIEGGLQGISSKVISVKGDKVELLMTILGSQRRVMASAWDLKRVA